MTRIEKILFYTFIFLLPFQIGKFLFALSPLPEFFYHQVFIYLSDILIVAFLLFWKVRILKDGQERQKLYDAIKKDLPLILFFIFSGISIFIADNEYLSFFHFIKLFEFIAFYFYIRQNFEHINIKKFAYILIFSAIFQVIIADAQFHFQESIGLKYFGESPLSPTVDGVAKINESGFKLIRPYGTFPHPNIFAAFLILALFMTYFALFSNGAKMGQNKTVTIINKAKYILPYFALFALIFGLILTFSRSAICSFVVMSALFFVTIALKKELAIEKWNILKVAIISVFIFVILGAVFNKEIFFRSQSILNDSSLSQRIFYNDIAKNEIISSPIFGVGIGNFITEFYSQNSDLMNWQYQPAHNLFVLVSAEIGLIAVLLLIVFIIKSVVDFLNKSEKNIFQWSILFAVLAFLILANTDHYFWTIQQGQILFWMILGVVNSNNIKQ